MTRARARARISARAIIARGMCVIKFRRKQLIAADSWK